MEWTKKETLRKKPNKIIFYHVLNVKEILVGCTLGTRYTFSYLRYEQDRLSLGWEIYKHNNGIAEKWMDNSWIIHQSKRGK